MFYGARSVADVELIYRDGNGEFHTQPLADITTSGTLCDESGDMELVGYCQV